MGRIAPKRESQSRVCFAPDPQYTEAAAIGQVKGKVYLTPIVGIDGCARNIKVVTPLGYGLDDSSVSALKTWRFRKPKKQTPINIEFDFGPKFSPPRPINSANCEEIAGTAPASKH